MRREPFDSSVILATDYDPGSCTLEVEFRNHRVYRYLEAPPEEWMALQSTDSAGAYFSAHIRNDYECRRLVNLARTKHQAV